MLDGEGLDLLAIAVVPLLGDLAKVDSRAQAIERHREDDGRHLVPDDPVNARLERLRAPNGEVIALLKYRREEGNSLNVIPMRVGEENIARDAVSIGARDQRASELPHARAGVEDDEPPRRRAHLDARRISSVAHGVRPGGRNRAAGAPKTQMQSHE